MNAELKLAQLDTFVRSAANLEDQRGTILKMIMDIHDAMMDDDLEVLSATERGED